MQLRLAAIAIALALTAGLLDARADNLTGLIDHRGQPIVEAQFAPEYRLVYFGFTHCPDACPMGLQVLSDAIDRLGRLGDRITPVFVSLDPERDRPDVLKNYIEMFHPRMIAVTGDMAAIAELAKKYRVTFAKVPGSSAQSYTVDHSTTIYLTDAEGRILGRFPHEITPARLGQRLVEQLMRAQ